MNFQDPVIVAHIRNAIRNAIRKHVSATSFAMQSFADELGNAGVEASNWFNDTVKPALLRL